MPLVEKYVEFPFMEGVDTSADPKALQAPKLVEASNCKLGSNGQISKRAGYSKLAPGSLASPLPGALAFTSAAQCMQPIGDNLTLLGTGCVYEYSKGANSWVRPAGNVGLADTAGQYVRLTSSSDPISPTSGIAAFDMLGAAYANGYICCVFSTAIVVYEAATMAVVVRTGSTAAMRVTSLGNYFGVLLGDPTGVGQIGIAIMNTANVSAGFTTYNISSTSHTAYLGADICADSTYFFVAYTESPTVTVGLRVARITTSGTVGIAGISASPLGKDAVAIKAVSTGQILVVWGDQTNLCSAAFADNTLAVSPSAYTIAAAADVRAITLGEFNDGVHHAICIYYEEGGPGAGADARDHQVTRRECSLSGGSQTHTASTLYGFTLAHAVVVDATGANEYVGLARPSDTDSVYVTAICTRTGSGTSSTKIAYASPGARYLPSVAVPTTNTKTLVSKFSSVCTDGSDTYFWLGQEKTNIKSSVSGGVTSYTYDSAVRLMRFRIKQQVASEYMSGQLFVGGAMPICTAGEVALTVGHCYPPEAPALADSAGGSLTASGVYQYVLVYEAHDPAGNVYKSAASLPTTITLGGGGANKTVTVTARTPFPHAVQVDATQTYWTIAVYRTAAAGTTFRRIGRVALSSYLSACQGQLTTTYTDTASDASIASNELLYTASGVLDNYAPPSCDALVRHKDRLFCIDRDTGNLAYSKEIIDGEGPAFNPALTVSTGLIAAQGKPVAFVSMETVGVVFWDKRIGYIHGDGPDDTGANGEFSQLQMLNSRVGMQAPWCYALTPVGLMFVDADLGIWRLQAGAEPDYIGRDVESFNGSTCVGVHVHEQSNEVRFSLSTGYVLVYNYVRDMWSWSRLLVGPGDGSVGILAACIWQNVHTVLCSNSQLYQESGYRDDSNYVPMTLTTGWISLDGLNGLQRIYDVKVLGAMSDNCRVTVTIARDYDTTQSDSFTRDALASDPYQFVCRMKHQRCKAIRVSIADAAPVTGAAAVTYAGVKLTGLRINYGVLPNKLERARWAT